MQLTHQYHLARVVILDPEAVDAGGELQNEPTAPPVAPPIEHNNTHGHSRHQGTPVMERLFKTNYGVSFSTCSNSDHLRRADERLS